MLSIWDTRLCKYFTSPKWSETLADYTIIQVIIPFHVTKLLPARTSAYSGNILCFWLAISLSVQLLKRKKDKNPTSAPHLKCLLTKSRYPEINGIGWSAFVFYHRFLSLWFFTSLWATGKMELYQQHQQILSMIKILFLFFWQYCARVTNTSSVL